MVRMTEKFVRILFEVKKAVGIYFTEVEPSKFLVYCTHTRVMYLAVLNKILYKCLIIYKITAKDNL